jgi:NADH:ubiquinone oxidoreductase subunit F (NADH-binding)
VTTMTAARTRLLHEPPADTPLLDPSVLIGAIEQAGLTGRGGAGFPTHRKLTAVLAAAGDGRQPVVVANAAEGEPASAKDLTLLAANPWLVLDGLRLITHALGAGGSHLYLSPRVAVAPLMAVLASRRDPVSVHIAPDAFVSGEESAVVAALAGRPAVPADKFVRVIDRGLGGAPTLVLNVETLAHIALVARYGPAWYRAQGTVDEPGTFLATVSGAVARPGVFEHPYGVALSDVVSAAGGGTARLRALLVGGYHGAWVPADAPVAVSRAGLREYGATPGAGVILALDWDRCPLAASARIVGYLAGQGAGQCGPCVNGLPRLAETLTRLAQTGLAQTGLAHGRVEPAEVERVAALVAGRGACRHPDGTVRLVASTLSCFADDVQAHLRGRCVTGRPA